MSTSSSVKDLLSAIKAVDKSQISEQERSELLAASAGLQAKLERPWDVLWRLIWITPAATASLRTLVHLKLFEKWVAVGGGSKTVAELAALADCDETLLVRLLQVVASVGLIKDTAPFTYEMNDFSESLAHAPQTATFDCMGDFLLPTWVQLPEFLRANEYRNPHMGPNNAAFNLAFNTDQTLFEHLTARPKQRESFANCMIGFAGSFTPWVDLFPTEQLLEGVGPDDVVVVDVGGGVGHDLMHIQKKHNLKTKQLVLQDQEGNVANPVSKDAFDARAHDFFTAQPIKGARAYYLHSVLHDWPDAQAVTILTHIRESMSPNSRVLVHDMVLKPQGNPPLTPSLDVLMMAVFNGLERTEQMWKQLATTAGLKIVKIHTSAASPQGIVEMILP